MGKVYLALRTHRYGALNVIEEDVTKHTHVVKTPAKQHEYQVPKVSFNTPICAQRYFGRLGDTVSPFCSPAIEAGSVVY